MEAAGAEVSLDVDMAVKVEIKATQSQLVSVKTGRKDPLGGFSLEPGGLAVMGW